MSKKCVDYTPLYDEGGLLVLSTTMTTTTTTNTVAAAAAAMKLHTAHNSMQTKSLAMIKRGVWRF